jgi:predicted nuclease of predicted toxin-antitoxin system
VNILDENIPRAQRELLEGWRIPVKQIGFNTGRQGMQDDEIIPFLVKQRRSIFFTRDSDFHNRTLCQARYCIVHLDVHINEAATFVRRLLRHPNFDTYTKRSGKVLRVSRGGISFWQVNDTQERHVGWKQDR